MGRGRAKAKQQKVARELKYNSQFTDFDALQRELGGSSESAHRDGVGTRDDSLRDDFADGFEDDFEDEGDSWAHAGS